METVIHKKTENKTTPSRWNRLADVVLQGGKLSRSEGQEILQSSDEEIMQLLAAAYRIRHQHFGKVVQLYYLKNAKSGLCQEDCGYCSQSKNSDAPIEKYRFLSEDDLMRGAKQAAEAEAKTYCIVASGRGPSDKEVEHVASVVKNIKQEYGLHICCCLGLLEPKQAETLAAAGVDRINHNLNTSRRFHPSIVTTHTYDDRLNTLKVARNAGMELCTGLIAGMGEEQEDILDVVFELQELGVESIPVNFLNAIDGTALEGTNDITPRDCLRILCLMRFAHPTTEIRIAGGREIKLRTLQPFGLYPANSMFISDYLTTTGQTPEEDFQMIADLGFEYISADAETKAMMDAK
ncbi:Biotin synthase [hydrothermal vent metagenome]|uniref:biotin synthase n=1 Tax=hydrothermal vent metagenome TaxID=652676 RepID=A0A3B1DTV3_9ZZZZ